MALHSFPNSPYAELIPSHPWFPADGALRDSAYEKLVPPLVAQVRERVFAQRKTGYEGASETSTSLLHWWFKREHLIEEADGSLSLFRYYFAEREAVETDHRANCVRVVPSLFQSNNAATWHNESIASRSASTRRRAGDRIIARINAHINARIIA